MTTIETKTAKNGAKLWYIDGKRVSHDKALESAAQNRVGNPFVIEYDTEQNHYLIQGGIEKHIYTDRRTFDKLNIRIDNYHGFTVYCGTCQLRTFACNFGAKNFAATIEDAFINGEHGIKITVDGKISILPAENVGNLTDSALAASNSRLAAFRTNDMATEIDVDEYAVTVDAQDVAVDAEVSNAIKANKLIDEYAARMAELKADLEKSKDIYDNAAEKRTTKLIEFQDAQKAVNEAKILVDRKREAVAKLGQAYAKVLERKLFDKPLMIPPTMLFIGQDGDVVGTGLEPLEILFHEHELKFQIVTDWIFLGEYDTPAQVETVIDDLKTAIAFGSRTEFRFPTVDEVNAWHNQLREDARRELEFEYQAAFGEEYTEPFHKIGDVIANLYTTHTA